MQPIISQFCQIMNTNVSEYLLTGRASVGPVITGNRAAFGCEGRLVIETLPYVIRRPGTYVLARTLRGARGRDGVVIASESVTLDLNWCELVGVTGSGAGVRVEGVRSGVVVKNGLVRRWSEGGIDASRAAGGRVEGVTILQCGAIGMSVGHGGVVRSCEVQGSLVNGIEAGPSANVSECVVRGNAWSGLVLLAESVAHDCEAEENFVGIDAAEFCNVTSCVCRGNGNDGLRLGQGSVAAKNLCEQNGDDGIQAGDFCVMSGNRCEGNGRSSGTGVGVYLKGEGCVVRGDREAGIARKGFGA